MSDLLLIDWYKYKKQTKYSTNKTSQGSCKLFCWKYF